MARAITYQGVTYPSVAEFCSAHDISYTLFYRRFKEGYSLEEIVEHRGFVKKAFHLKYKYPYDISEISKVTGIPVTSLTKYNNNGIVTTNKKSSTPKVKIHFQGKNYDNIHQLLEDHNNIPYEDYVKYSNQGYSLKSIVKGSYIEFSYYIEESDVTLKTKKDFKEFFNVSDTWICVQKKKGMTIPDIIEKRNDLFYLVYGDYFLTKSSIAKHYEQCPLELSYLTDRMGYTHEEALDHLYEIRKELQIETGDLSLKNLRHYCEKYNKSFPSLKRILRTGASLKEALESVNSLENNT